MTFFSFAPVLNLLRTARVLRLSIILHGNNESFINFSVLSKDELLSHLGLKSICWNLVILLKQTGIRRKNQYQELRRKKAGTQQRSRFKISLRKSRLPIKSLIRQAGIPQKKHYKSYVRQAERPTKNLFCVPSEKSRNTNEKSVPKSLLVMTHHSTVWANPLWFTWGIKYLY